jgi:TRAP transporter TAXI family solute receptor
MKKFIIASLILFSTGSIAAEQIKLYTGNIAGIYYQVGQEICIIIGCPLETSNGSIDNIEKLEDPKNKSLAIVSSDILHDAYYSINAFEGYNYKHIAPLCSLYEESYTLVVRKNSKINSFYDLKNKIVNVGKTNSIHYHATKKMLELYNMDIHDFKNVSHLDLDLQGEALCKGTIDAAVYSVGHPDISLSKTASLCDIKIISINNKAIQNLITEKPYFIYTTIKAGTYPGINLDIKTLGVMATLVASQNLSNNYIYNLMNKINNSNLKLKLIHPALHDINLDTMVPLHPGAEEFYRQNH